MRKKPVINLAASVQSRLLNLSRARGEQYNLILRRFAIERLLYRLGQSAHRERFVLKGAMLFLLWIGELHRPTQDLDLLAYGDDSPQVLVALFSELCQLTVEADGLRFDPATILGETIDIEHVPAWVCRHCGEQYYDAPVYKQMERIAQRREQSHRRISFPLAEFEMALPA